MHAHCVHRNFVHRVVRLAEMYPSRDRAHPPRSYILPSHTIDTDSIYMYAHTKIRIVRVS